jgi:tetratricopeptide (TPR) repeat protein
MKTAWQHLGVARANFDDCAHAIAAFEQALALDPALAEAHFGRAVCLSRQGNLDEARASLRRAVELNPRFAEQARRIPGLAMQGSDVDVAQPAATDTERTPADDTDG